MRDYSDPKGLCPIDPAEFPSIKHQTITLIRIHPKDGVLQARLHSGKRIVLAMDTKRATYMAVWTGNHTSDVFAVTLADIERWRTELPPDPEA
jgi:hypothetical protein